MPHIEMQNAVSRRLLFPLFYMSSTSDLPLSLATVTKKLRTREQQEIKPLVEISFFSESSGHAGNYWQSTERCQLNQEDLK